MESVGKDQPSSTRLVCNQCGTLCPILSVCHYLRGRVYRNQYIMYVTPCITRCIKHYCSDCHMMHAYDHIWHYMLYVTPSNMLYVTASNMLYVTPSNMLYVTPSNMLYVTPSNMLYVTPSNMLYVTPSKLGFQEQELAKCGTNISSPSSSSLSS